MTDLLNKRLEARHWYNQRSPLAVQTKDGRSMVISPETAQHAFSADPDFWKESGVIRFFWGTEELTASLSDFLEATEKAYSA